MRTISGFKKSIILTLVLIGLLFLLIGTAEATELRIRVKVAKADIRLKPNEESMVISQAPLGAVLVSEDMVGDWYKVSLPPDEHGVVVSGFIHQSMVTVVEEVKETVEEKKLEEEAPVMRKPEKKERGKVAMGLKAGLNFANLHGEDVEDLQDFVGEDLESKMGFCVGVFITYNIIDMFAIQPEILYTMKGAKYEEEIWRGTLKASINLSYLEIPVLAKFLIPTQSDIKPSIYAGPSLSIKLSGKAKAEYNGDAEEEDLEDVKDTDLGLVIGAGLDLKLGFLGQGKVTVDIRYTLGVTTISEEKEEDVKNKAISLMIGYKF